MSTGSLRFVVSGAESAGSTCVGVFDASGLPVLVGTAELVGAVGVPMSRQARDESIAARIMSVLVWVIIFMTIKREIITLAVRVASLVRLKSTG